MRSSTAAAPSANSTWPRSPRPRRAAASRPVWKSKFYGAFVLNHRVVLHAIDATPARWRGDAGSSPLDRARTAASSPRNDLVKNCRVHPTHWLISTQAEALCRCWVDLVRRQVPHAFGRHVRVQSLCQDQRPPPRHQRDACSMAWRCRFLAARQSQDGRVIAEK